MRRSGLGVVLFVLVLANVANAKPGYNGYSGLTANKTCSDCHSGGTKPTLTLKTGPSSLTPGQVGTYTLTVAGGAARTEIDVAVTDNSGTKRTLTPDNTSTMSASNNTEVIPSGNYKAGASSDYTFSVTAPTGATSLTIYATGMASNGSGTGGDGVESKTFNVPISGSSGDAGVTQTDAGTKSDAGSSTTDAGAGSSVDSGVDEADSGDPNGEPDTLNPSGSGSGCATSGGASTSSGVFLLVAAVLAISARKRPQR